MGATFLNYLDTPIIAKCPEDNFSNQFYIKYGFKLSHIEEGKKKKIKYMDIIKGIKLCTNFIINNWKKL